MEILSAVAFCEGVKANKQPELMIRVCDGASCATNGSEETFKQTESFLEQREKRQSNPKVKVERVGCFG